MKSVSNTSADEFILRFNHISSTNNRRWKTVEKDTAQDRTRKVDEKGLSCHLLALPNKGIAFTIIGFKERGNTKSTYVDIKRKINPQNIQCAPFAADVALRHVFGISIMEGIERHYGPSGKNNTFT